MVNMWLARSLSVSAVTALHCCLLDDIHQSVRAARNGLIRMRVSPGFSWGKKWPPFIACPWVCGAPTHVSLSDRSHASKNDIKHREALYVLRTIQGHSFAMARFEYGKWSPVEVFRCGHKRAGLCRSGCDSRQVSERGIATSGWCAGSHAQARWPAHSHTTLTILKRF